VQSIDVQRSIIVSYMIFRSRGETAKGVREVSAMVFK
jgi:hypothetical protein